MNKINGTATTRDYPGAPSWANQVDDESSNDSDGNNVTFFYGDRGSDDAYLTRMDTITSDGITEGALEVRVWFGGNCVDTPVTPTTVAELRKLAADVLSVAEQIESL